MLTPDFTFLYVDSAPTSAAFYARLMGVEPMESSPNFAMFKFPNGQRFGVWARSDVQPAPTTPPGGAEYAFMVQGDDAVRALHADWQSKGIDIIQSPEAKEFGFTFTARDPDGHRLRVFSPGAE